MGISSRTATITLSGSSVTNQTVTLLEIGPTGVLDLITSKLKFYSNPTTGLIYFELDYDISDIVIIRVFNNLGSVVFEKNNISIQGKKAESLNLNDLPNGIYILQILGSRIDLSRSLIIQK